MGEKEIVREEGEGRGSRSREDGGGGRKTEGVEGRSNKMFSESVHEWIRCQSDHPVINKCVNTTCKSPSL